MKNYYKSGFFILLALLLIAAVGDTYRSVMVDSNGLVQNDPMSKTNNISIYTAPSSAYHLMRYTDMTNNASSLFKLPIARGGTGTNTTFLAGSWTNQYALTVNSNIIVGTYATIGEYADSSFEFTHLLKNYASSNPNTFVWNASPTGNSGFTFKDSSGNNIGSINIQNNTSNLVLAQNINVKSVNIDVPSGTAALAIGQGVTTNYFDMVVGRSLTVAIKSTSLTNNSTVYQVNGIQAFTGSVTNLGPALGSSNVLVYASGIVTNYFKIP